ncbi:uncharacterized protein LOC133533407 [Cydia pomonella]|uniref:uncharacterized protein LOC133533407 n=1 Tax=Cydia pomonella TaxID=82600 RepID=UPI002ADD7C12|nr:uncharacterized protein LOC133533407 [Cydia pomonella]
MALYGAPIWAGRLNDETKALLRRPQRVIARRIIRGYSTIGHAAACALAGILPWDLDARLLAERYNQRMELRIADERLAPQELEARLAAAKKRERDRWKSQLEDEPYGTYTIGALLPSFDSWLDRKSGILTYRQVQVMTGHGCFGHYLYTIQREPSPVCHHCGYEDDTAHHTTVECPTWAPERRELELVLNVDDLSLHNIVARILVSERSWEAFNNFCEQVIRKKEEAERMREERADAHPLRRRRRGTRQRQFVNALIPQ